MTTGIKKLFRVTVLTISRDADLHQRRKKKKKMGTKDPKDPTGTELVQEYFVSTYVCRGTPKIQ